MIETHRIVDTASSDIVKPFPLKYEKNKDLEREWRAGAGGVCGRPSQDWSTPADKSITGDTGTDIIRITEAILIRPCLWNCLITGVN